jgi:hypothetical protein
MPVQPTDRRRSTVSEAEHLVTVYQDLLTHCEARIAEAKASKDGTTLAYLLQRRARYQERMALLVRTVESRERV